MAVTYERLGETVLSSANSQITFSSITQSYEDLILYIYGASSYTGAWDDLVVRINLVTNNYNNTTMRFNIGSTTPSASATYNNSFAYNYMGGAGNFSLTKLIFPSYARTNANQYKKVLGLSYVNQATTTGRADLTDCTNFSSSTAAVTRIDLYLSSGNFTAGTTATLYGIKSA